MSWNILQGNYERHQANQKRKLPDKCKTCGLNVVYCVKNEEMKKTLDTEKELDKYGLGNYPGRHYTLRTDGESSTSFCALGYHRRRRKQRKCWDRQMQAPNLQLEDYLSMHQARRGTHIAIVAAVAATLFTVLNLWVSFSLRP